MAVLTSRSEEVGAESQWPWGGRRGRWIASFILIVLSRGTPREIEWRRRRSIGGEGEREAQLNSFPSIYLHFTMREALQMRGYDLPALGVHIRAGV